jgi:hypothetical protein
MILNVNFGIEGLIKRERKKDSLGNKISSQASALNKYREKQLWYKELELDRFRDPSGREPYLYIYIRIIPQHRVSYQLVIKK